MKTLINGKFDTGPEEILRSPIQRVTINYGKIGEAIVNVQLTTNQLLIRRLGFAVAFPLEQLVAAAKAIEPGLVPQPTPNSPPTVPAQESTKPEIAPL
jgi:hypothetical protein